MTGVILPHGRRDRQAGNRHTLVPNSLGSACQGKVSRRERRQNRLAHQKCDRSRFHPYLKLGIRHLSIPLKLGKSASLQVFFLVDDEGLEPPTLTV